MSETKPKSPRAAQPTSASRVNTADRILEASLRLFNEHGFRNVAALKIAMHLGISPGHLAYHFKTKNDIVLAVFPQLEREVREAKMPGGPFLPSAAVHHQINFARVLWRYRFFFNAITHLLADDADLRQRFFDLQAVVVGAMGDLLEELIVQGDMEKVAPSSTDLLGRCCWMMWLSWLRFEHIAHPRNEEPSDAAIYDAISLTSTVLGPYFNTQFNALMEAELRKALPDSVATSKTACTKVQNRKKPASRSTAPNGKSRSATKRRTG